MHPILLQFQEIFQGSMPKWVWQRSPESIVDHVPVFTFHTIQPEAFEAQLRFLKENGYQTITSEALYQYVMHGKKSWDKAVMLTFDDGRKSVWSVAYPLLKKYEMQATVFLSPGIMDDSEHVSSNLEDVWQGHVNIKRVQQCDQGISPTLNWKEIQIMHEEGVIDFQCHSFSHQRIPIGSDIIGFVTPELIVSHYFKFNIPYHPDVLPRKTEASEYLGAPVYQSAPFLSDKWMYREDKTFRNECIREYKKHCSVIKKGLVKEAVESYLRLKKHEQSQKDQATYESQNEQEKRITEELAKAKQAIESHLQGHAVRHLAYPWGAGSDVAVRCSEDAGYVSNFWSTLPGKSKNQIGNDPFHLVRSKHDFIWRLPGKGRRSLADVFLSKFKRRVSGKIDY